MVTFTPVEGSSNIASTAHDGKYLYMRFLRAGGGTALYRYEGVPIGMYREMMEHPLQGSIGKHFHAFIKPHFVGSKMKEPRN